MRFDRRLATPKDSRCDGGKLCMLDMPFLLFAFTLLTDSSTSFRNLECSFVVAFVVAIDIDEKFLAILHFEKWVWGGLLTEEWRGWRTKDFVWRVIREAVISMAIRAQIIFYSY